VNGLAISRDNHIEIDRACHTHGIYGGPTFCCCRQSDAIRSALENSDTPFSHRLKDSKSKSTTVISNIVKSSFFSSKDIVIESYDFDRDAMNKQA
jgi:hypothetical protein